LESSKFERFVMKALITKNSYSLEIMETKDIYSFNPLCIFLTTKSQRNTNIFTGY
jgi:hypothetical protein